MIDHIVNDFQDYFYSLVRQIPGGMVTSYGDLAEALGDRISARACGYMLSVNPLPDVTPCYRVVYSTGEVGNYTHPLGPDEKIRRLRNDGIVIENKKIKNFESVHFNSFISDFPLKRLQEEQSRMTELISPDDGNIEDGIAGVDVSYFGDIAIGCAIFSRSGQITKKFSVSKVSFPYIPGYLSYREFVPMALLVKGFNGIVYIDGNGQLHPRKMGLATFVGVKMGLKTIGVAKSLGFGKLEGNWILVGKEKRGFVINNKTVISAGNRISLEKAVSLTHNEFGNKYPWILRMAHNECTGLVSRLKSNAQGSKYNKK